MVLIILYGISADNNACLLQYCLPLSEDLLEVPSPMLWIGLVLPSHPKPLQQYALATLIGGDCDIYVILELFEMNIMFFFNELTKPYWILKNKGMWVGS